VDFYGHALDFTAASISNVKAPFTINKQSVTHAVNSIKNEDIEDIINEVRATQALFHLDGMGVVLLSDKIITQITPSKNTQSLLKYRLLQALNYDVQLTYTRNTISCFGRLAQKPASSVYIVYRNKRYTNLNFNDMRTHGIRYVYDDTEYTSLSKALDYSGEAPEVNAKQSSSYLTWSFQGKLYRLKAVQNISFNEYLNDLPQFELGPAYVKMSHSKEFQSSVLTPLEQYLATMHSNMQKANFLLQFAQSAFEYKTDGDQYGQEKYNFPEETVNTTFSDCEDRTILLAFLYKKLLGFESVMLHFENEQHVCLGVKIPNRSNAYSFKYKDEAYMVCEPTGIGFDVGETGIPLKKITEVIDLF
ncbi:MAG: hypothetical protein ACI8SE_002185, partial [Bacteroidia bacterium]